MTRSKNLAYLSLGALLLAACFRSSSIGVLAAWPALTLILYAWRQMPVRLGLPAIGVALYAALAIGHAGQWPMRGPLYSAAIAGATVNVVIPFALDRWIRGRLPGPMATLAFPLSWVAVEFLFSRMPGGPGTWGALAYTQYGNLTLMQLASVTGIWGLSFLLTWVASVASWAWARGFAVDEAARVVLACAGVLGIVLLGGGTRLALASPASRTIRVAAVTLPPGLFAPGEMFRIADGRISADAVAGKLARLHEWFFAHTEREAAAGAQLVAWPEMNFLVAASDEPAAIERARRLAAARHIYLSMAIGAVTTGARKPFENKVVLVGPSGEVIYSYLKSHPVAGWEARVMKVGDGRVPLVSTAIGRVSTAICFDNDLPEFVRQIGHGGADLWILPANDWEAIRYGHFEMAAFRAIENGTPILRAAATGISGAFDPRGRVVAATNHLSGAPTMVAELPVGHLATTYARIGDVFAWTCVLGSFAMALLAVRSGAQAADAAWRRSPITA